MKARHNHPKRVCILGAFGYDCNKLDGQTVKTRNIFKLIQDNHPGKLYAMDTMHIRQRPLSAFKLFWYLCRCDILVLIPCLNNLTYIFPIIYWLSKILRFDIIHICIGGWQVEYFLGDERFKSHPMQLRQSKRIKAFMPEMSAVDLELKNRLGFSNTEMFPNFRFISIDKVHSKTESTTLRLVFLARVNKLKGYHTIFKFAEFVKKNSLDIIIDFYGPINDEDKKDFFDLLDSYKEIVIYKGVLRQEEVTLTLQHYDVMLLPTRVFTEGFPGSILDAYIAGIPVIATEWKYAHEFIDNGVTGFVISFKDCQKEFNEKIMALYEDRVLLSQMKLNSFQKRIHYSDRFAWSILSKYI